MSDMPHPVIPIAIAAGIVIMSLAIAACIIWRASKIPTLFAHSVPAVTDLPAGDDFATSPRVLPPTCRPQDW